MSTAIEAIRRRPGMYVGDPISPRVLLDTLVEIVLDLHASRRATRLDVTLDGPWIEVRDNGPGMSPELIGVAFTTLLHRPVYEDTARRSGGMLGGGWVVIAALASRVEVDTTHRGIRRTFEIDHGVATAPTEQLISTTNGTRIRFRGDPSMFQTLRLDRTAVQARLADLANLRPTLRITLDGVVAGDGGILERAKLLAGTVRDTRFIDRRVGAMEIQLALAWGSERSRRITFVNLAPMTFGTHTIALRHALLGRRRNLVAILAIDHVHEPRWGAARDGLRNIEVGIALEMVLEQELGG